MHRLSRLLRFELGPRPAQVHSQQRFVCIGAGGEVRADQAHRGYDVHYDNAYKNINPLSAGGQLLGSRVGTLRWREDCAAAFRLSGRIVFCQHKRTRVCVFFANVFTNFSYCFS